MLSHLLLCGLVKDRRGISDDGKLHESAAGRKVAAALRQESNLLLHLAVALSRMK